MLTEQEKTVLEEAKVANPHWFNAMLRAGEIMTERRQKYAGKNHPYYNFVDMAYRLGESIANVFKFYLNIKTSRLSTTDQDFSDERVLDTWIDVANYALIAAGWSLDDLKEEDVIQRAPWTLNSHPFHLEMLHELMKDASENEDTN